MRLCLWIFRLYSGEKFRLPPPVLEKKKRRHSMRVGYNTGHLFAIHFKGNRHELTQRTCGQRSAGRHLRRDRDPGERRSY
ncbi:hypothetical protein DVB85_17570 [Klebsiella oxytoca]|nr:hypothetical protein DMP75_06880 [Klebsiella michiganensis]EBX6544860.1 hypothetical protein [Salmonella enterica subsp. enterica serovar Larochelle]MBX4672672.1 hypothetical protein [Klebsiella sp. CVUAS 5466.2]MBX4755526.1 hypothetical protein [Klebsiella sp. CVUAS 8534.2]MBX4777842.1 hypothetical protein [Klebsiella sp. CVUAS 10191.3]RDA98908.1 hypothetical protein DVB85_17570 [Klebsiella oxytoca]TYF94162.1 hypothetical protein DJ542_08125 [Klebsiella grimontii]